ncbi:MAG: transporter permease, partial [Bacillota bacterium]|nr:transporter permease [Bacillota bacterium]
GYELKACGFNPQASKYAGINEKRNIVLSMVIAGMLAGLGGGLLYLSGANGRRIKVVDVLAAEGFNGIPVALLGLSNPIGIIFSAIFISYITQGGNYLQTLDFVPEVIDIIIACIIYFSAFALIFRSILPRIIKFSKERSATKSDNHENNDGSEDATGKEAEIADLRATADPQYQMTEDTALAVDNGLDNATGTTDSTQAESAEEGNK